MNYKALILTVLFLLPMAHASEEKLFCASFYAFYYKKEIEKLPNDKAMHCTMSCYLAVRCPKEEADLLGYLKEFWDLIGPGEYDTEDIKANKVGIKLASRGSKSYCKSECLKRYVKKKEKR